MIENLRVFGHATAVAFADMRAMYTWRTWLFAWTGRVVVQVIFFALIGTLLDSPATVEFLLIGNVAWAATSITLLSVPSTTWERRLGTLPLLVSSPSPVFITFLGRSVQWIPDALATSLIGLVVAAAAFEVSFPLPQALWALPVFALVVVTTYGLGAFLGGVVLRAMDARNTVSNIVMGVMAIVCGVNVPVEFFPGAVQVFAQIFPLTHGLEAVRSILAVAPAGEVFPDV
ncbi:MAG: ABC transporter permease, partial [Acidimicrobiia bacterium]|nr:ABC transporter permease [Acidimicrobiia bacterium]